MKLSSLDIFLASLCGTIIILPALMLTWLSRHFFSKAGYYLPFIQVVIFIGCFFLSSLLLLWALRFFFPMTLGQHDLDKGTTSIIWKLQGYLYIFNLGIFINSYLIPVNIRSFIFSLLGADMGKNVMIGGKILEPTLVSIGDYTILGEDTLITAHAKEGNKVDLQRVTIGSEVTVGVKAVIMPGVSIGDHSIIAAGAVVVKGTQIPENEIWGGIPSKKIGEV